MTERDNMAVLTLLRPQTFCLRPDQIERLQVHAAQRGLSLQALVLELVDRALSDLSAPLEGRYEGYGHLRQTLDMYERVVGEIESSVQRLSALMEEEVEHLQGGEE